GIAQSSQELIKINQSGYYVKGPKVAVLTSDFKDDDYASKNFLGFFLLRANATDTVFKSALSDLHQSRNSSLQTRIADFSAFQQGGRFIIYIPGIGNSYPFEIKANVHKEAAVAALKGFYYQRVSMPLEERYAGKWKRPAGHPDTKVEIHPSAASDKRPAGSFISSSGGWYDAGDYNKYIVNSGITCGTMLAAYEDFPAYFEGLKTNIPESSNKVPDVLDEILYNLRWMLTMQDPNDGGVYNKCTNASFDGMVMPGYTKLPRYVVQKSTAATLDFAAVMAQAARIFKKFGTQYPGLSDSCLKAATTAWQWAQKNPAMAYNQNEINTKFKPVISTGGYGDRSFKDEWFWAASELLATTGSKVYSDTVSTSIMDSLGLPSWANVKMLGYYTLIRFKKTLPFISKESLASGENKVVQLANNMISLVDSNAFGTVMGGSRRDFIWGSSSVAANQGILLINAYIITKDKKYTDFALSNLDYLLGRNATGYSFLTGIGHKQTMRPHHRPSIADAVVEPVPGLLSGGPNPGKQDKCHYDYSDPERAFSDTDCSYASNEIAINWNAPAVYLFNAIEALQKDMGY
ncbi:MAG TPA: glycoside hydrolase family 9 protein, partial [Chitinophagaceae bacterium]|nr:glycoside hydrolase family 9 protein [Chitinophagaceae bacterium]